MRGGESNFRVSFNGKLFQSMTINIKLQKFRLIFLRTRSEGSVSFLSFEMEFYSQM